jgi:hypothetical protein
MAGLSARCKARLGSGAASQQLRGLPGCYRETPGLSATDYRREGPAELDYRLRGPQHRDIQDRLRDLAWLEACQAGERSWSAIDVPRRAKSV